MKQQQLTFEKGMTNVPSDAICSDNALEYAEGMVYRDGEHHVIQKPKEKDSLNSSSTTLVFVHKLGNGEKSYIYDSGTTLSYKKGETSGNIYAHSGSSLKSITAIGKTLIASFDGTLYYGLFINDSYKDITNIPEPDVTFSLEDPSSIQDLIPTKINHLSYYGIIDGNGVSDQDKYNNLVVGLYSQNIKEIAQSKGFSKPFLARAALELYDGSYTYITNPVMLFPSITMSSYARLESSSNTFYLYTIYNYLICSQGTDYSQLYGDIVKDVVIFVSNGINTYDTTVDQKLIQCGREEEIANCIYKKRAAGSISASDPKYSTFYQEKTAYEQTDPLKRWKVLERRDNLSISKDLCEASVFYKFCSLGTSSVSELNTAEKIDTHLLENITTQEQLPYDDYYSRNLLKAEFLYSYNQRLNMGGVSRGVFEGFEHFLPYEKNEEDAQDPSDSGYNAYVSIRTESGDVRVMHVYTTKDKQGIYFYYPDSRAKHVVIINTRTGKCVCDQDLIEHKGLNGAYFFRGLPGVEVDAEQVDSTVFFPSYNNDFVESLGGYLLTSEVNNPFVFRASGYNIVGTGDIIGMAAQTQALSQGQFGQYPLIVFTTEGIWAMSLNNTGLFTAIHPMSREVALESNPAITPVDGAIFFVSKKGLMVIEGSKVVCVSEQLKGKTADSLPIGMGNFCDFLATCFIAYDYRDSLLWIFDGHTSQGSFVGSRYCYIYSIKSGTFAVYDFGTSNIIKSSVNDYPDYLIQDKGTNGKVYTLYGRTDVNVEAAGSTTYPAVMKSRPMKLENGLALKRIIQMKHIKNMDDTYTTTSGTPPVTTTHPTLVFSMEGSNNAKTWCPLTSLRSIPWKYYRFTYTFEHLKATDTFAGTVVVTEEVRTNKLR